MSILEQVLQGISDGVTAAASEQGDLDVLRRIINPDAIESRKEAAQLLTEGLGYDPETYWNRREMTATYDAERVFPTGDSSSVIDAALARYEMLRSALLGAALWDKDVNIVPKDDQEVIQDHDQCMGIEDDDDDESIADLAKRLSDSAFESDDEDDPTVLDDEDDDDD